MCAQINITNFWNGYADIRCKEVMYPYIAETCRAACRHRGGLGFSKDIASAYHLVGIDENSQQFFGGGGLEMFDACACAHRVLSRRRPLRAPAGIEILGYWFVYVVLHLIDVHPDTVKIEG